MLVNQELKPSLSTKPEIIALTLQMQGILSNIFGLAISDIEVAKTRASFLAWYSSWHSNVFDCS